MRQSESVPAMAHRPMFHRSSGSRTSFTSVIQMPVIDENEEARSPPPLTTMTTTTPLRIPLKSYRRSIARGLPPPYVPVTSLPPVYRPPYMEAAEKKAKQDVENGTAAARLQKKPLDEKTRYAEKKRRCRSFVLIGVVVAVIVGLAIGLTLGLRNRSNSGDSSDANEAALQYPAGEYSFETNLRGTTTNCTTNPVTWRCYPYDEDSSATFFWKIDEDAMSRFTVSSTDNPFAPTFSNISMDLLDGNQATERLVFSFSMNKTVVPSDSLTPTNRAARCTFVDTDFTATLWTRQKGSTTIKTPQNEEGGRFGEWLGDVEVVQSKESEPGLISCEDNDGAVIADVQSLAGTCECRYANF